MRARAASGFANLGKGFCLGLLAASFAPHQAAAAAADDAAQLPGLSRPSSAHESPAQAVTAAPFIIDAKATVAHPPKRADFGRERASHDARQLADWIVDSDDSLSMPFAIVDKTDARVFVFDAHGHLRGAAAALLGLALGDDAVPGIGDRPMAGIRPEERTTPAGRFVAALDRNLRGKEILWVDYDGAISMHPVVKGTLEERRAKRLATPTPADNRISYGCINVPTNFFENVVRPAFTGTNGIVYVLPETRSARVVFSSYDVDEQARLKAGQVVPAQAAAAAAAH